MRRLHIFLFVLVLTLAVLLTLAFVSWYLSVAAPSYYNSSWINQMWGEMGGSSNHNGMMGEGGANGNPTTASYLWLIPSILAVIVAVAIIGIAFYLYMPELKYIKPKATCNPTKTNNIQNSNKGSSNAETLKIENNQSSATVLPNSSTNSFNNCDVVLKTMTSEEQKVFNVLVSHNGKYLQKYVVKESGLSRLKTHRIVARFAERGIVTVEEFGNTNEIRLADWVIGDGSSPNIL